MLGIRAVLSFGTARGIAVLHFRAASLAAGFFFTTRFRTRGIAPRFITVKTGSLRTGKRHGPGVLWPGGAAQFAHLGGEGADFAAEFFDAALRLRLRSLRTFLGAAVAGMELSAVFSTGASAVFFALHVLDAGGHFLHSCGAQMPQCLAQVLGTFVMATLVAGAWRRLRGIARRRRWLLGMKGERRKGGGEKREEGSCFHAGVQPGSWMLVAGNVNAGAALPG